MYKKRENLRIGRYIKKYYNLTKNSSNIKTDLYHYVSTYPYMRPKTSMANCKTLTFIEVRKKGRCKYL